MFSSGKRFWNPSECLITQLRYRTHKHTHKHITLRCKTFNGQHCVHRPLHPSSTVLYSVSKHTGLDSLPHHIEQSAQIELHPH